MKKLVYYVVCLALAALGVFLGIIILIPALSSSSAFIQYAAVGGCGLLLAIIGAIFLAKPTERGLAKLTEKIVTSFSQMSMPEVIAVVVGLIFGLIIASLGASVVSRIAIIGPYLSVIILLVFAYLGALIGYRKRDDFASFISSRQRDHRENLEKIIRRSEQSEKKGRKKEEHRGTPKILDTSVIIDGRISDIYRTGFLDGELIVANFVLEELRHIADSSNTLKRNRGRGGLDCLNAMRNEFGDYIVVTEKDYHDISEVDSKLIKLAQDMHGVVVTNDFNLNKVAKLQDMKVLNINELSNAVKPIVLPGEEMSALIVKEGKEANQGVAYLDDGTMVVVENGRLYIGRNLQVIVTSILQTAAGRMVFVRPKFDKDGKVIDME